MNLSIPTLDLDRITATVIKAYFTADLHVDVMAENVIPLKRLIRKHGLTVDEVPKLTRHEAARYLAEQTGRQMIQGTVSTEPLSGFLFANAVGGWILVRQSDPLVRRRFTIAHELGHYLLHFLPALEAASARQDEDLMEFEERMSAPEKIADENEMGTGAATLSDGIGEEISALDQEAVEKQADAFAAAILMPQAMCRRLIAKYVDRGMSERRVLARRLASECLVLQR